MLTISSSCNTNQENIIQNPQPTDTEIKGKVRDSITEEGISDVLISTTPSTKTAISDSTGKFIISDIEAGNYILHFLKKGYHHDSLAVNVGRNESKDIEQDLHKIDYKKEITLSTDSLTYHFKGITLVIPIKVENNTDTTIYYGKCGGTPEFATSKYNNGNWSTGGFWGSPCWAVYLWETVDVLPYSSSSDSLYVTNTGIYKFHLLYGLSFGNSGSDTLASNRFEVVD